MRVDDATDDFEQFIERGMLDPRTATTTRVDACGAEVDADRAE